MQALLGAACCLECQSLYVLMRSALNPLIPYPNPLTLTPNLTQTHIPHHTHKMGIHFHFNLTFKAIM